MGVYAISTVIHMISGHAYARAPRAHLSTSTALVTHILNTPGCLDGVSLNRLRTLHERYEGQCDTDTVLREEAVSQLTQIVDDLMNDIPGQRRTGELWMEYIRQVRVLLLFIWWSGRETGTCTCMPYLR